MGENLLSVSEVARLLGAKPKDISDLFYSRELRDDIAPIVAGRRLIPEGYVEVIRAVLQRLERQVSQQPIRIPEPEPTCHTRRIDMPLRGVKPTKIQKRLKLFLYGPPNSGKTFASIASNTED